MGLQLQINVAQLLMERIGTTKDVTFDGSELELEEEPPAYVRGRLRLTRTDAGVWVSGPVTMSADYICSRCLVPFATWEHVDVNDVFLPIVDIVTGARIDHDEGSNVDTQSIDGQHVLDLNDTLRQYKLAAIPLAPVCRESCEGICPECGIDLNNATCSCEQYVDQRWAKLRELLR